MPVYEYICQNCKEVTEIKTSMEEKEKGLQPECPSCKSKAMAQYFGNMKVVSSYPLH